MADSEPNFVGLFGGESNPVTLKSGEVLFKKGDPAQSMYIVLSGELRIDDDGIVYESVSAGGLVGEMALIDRGPRSATITATTDASLAEIDEKRFLFLVREAPSFALNVMRVLTRRLRRSNTSIEA
jgi:CRP/FNR family transcriptional regulator, cyclic AMP receptor protein